MFESMLTISYRYMGGSMPEKAFEQTNYAGGLHNYGEEIRSVLPKFDGFHVVNGGVKAGA